MLRSCFNPSRIRRKRPELRLIISSATIDAEAFLSYFNSHTESNTPEAAILSVEGRMFPVEIGYLAEPTMDYVQSAVQAVFDLHLAVSPSKWLFGHMVKVLSVL